MSRWSAIGETSNSWMLGVSWRRYWAPSVADIEFDGRTTRIGLTLTGSRSVSNSKFYFQLQLQALSIMQVWVHLFWTVHTAVHVEAGLAVQHSEFLSTSAITRSNINNALVPFSYSKSYSKSAIDVPILNFDSYSKRRAPKIEVIKSNSKDFSFSFSGTRT